MMMHRLSLSCRSAAAAAAAVAFKHRNGCRGSALAGSSTLLRRQRGLAAAAAATTTTATATKADNHKNNNNSNETADEKTIKVTVQLPPNLTIDPRSSFAPIREKPQRRQPYQDDDDEGRGGGTRKRSSGGRSDKTKKEHATAAAAAETATAGSTTASTRNENNNIDDKNPLGILQDELDGTMNQQKKDVVGSEEEEYDDDDDYDDDDEDDGLWVMPDRNDGVVFAVPLPERLHVDVHTIFAPAYDSKVGSIWLDETVFGRDPVRVDLIKRAVDYYRAKKRGRRKAKTKTIAEVSGSGRKIRKQKGGGVARAGHSRPPHHRGGAKAHGPKNTTDYGKTKLNKKVRRLALAHALSQKLLEGNLILWDQLHGLPTHKTGELARLLEPWEIGGRNGTTALILDHYYQQKEDDDDEDSNNSKDDNDTDNSSRTTKPPAALSYRGVPANLWVASANQWKIKVGNDHQANVYDILKHEKLVLTLEALMQIEGRLKSYF